MKNLENKNTNSIFFENNLLCCGFFSIGQPRHVEVKLKCKKSDSPSAVSIYLLEPKTCE